HRPRIVRFLALLLGTTFAPAAEKQAAEQPDQTEQYGQAEQRNGKIESHLGLLWSRDRRPGVTCPPSTRPGMLPAGSPPGQPASCVSCLPFAFPASSSCG